jgi:hypothetical protein
MPQEFLNGVSFAQQRIDAFKKLLIDNTDDGDTLEKIRLEIALDTLDRLDQSINDAINEL